MVAAKVSNTGDGPLKVFVILHPVEEPSDSFGVAPDFDEPILFDSVEVLVVGDQNRIEMEAGCSMDDVRELAIGEEGRTSIDLLLGRIHLDQRLLQIVQQVGCAQRLGVFFIFNDEKLIGEKLRGAVQKMIYEFGAPRPSAFDRGDEDGVIEEIP